jgi:DMSO/TMAO reductase YedYZ heme-binding membrane subunit
VTAVLIVLALVAGTQLRFFLDFGAGVLSLVSLSCAVIWGLVCTTDHILLGPRERLITQGIHRALGVSAVGFLVLHVTTKVAEAHWPLVGAFLPLGVVGQDGLIALGVIAGYLMILSAATGAMRSIFAAKRHPVRWRLLHSTSYVSWCTALIHGLNAGRSAKPFFVWAYTLSLLGVGIALLIRLRKVRGEALFGNPRGTAAPTMDDINASRGGSRRRAARPRQAVPTGGLEPAYTEPLPPMQLKQPQPPRQQPDYGYGYPPMADPASTGQLPPVQAPQQQPTAWDGTPAYGTPAYGTPAYGTLAYGTPVYGTPIPPAPVQPTPEPAQGTGPGGTRLQPVAWQQSNPGPYEGRR